MTDTEVTDTHVHARERNETEPRGDLCIRTLAMPADTNANGDIFGGWLLSQMDVGGGVFASKVAKSRTVTVAIEAMNFRKAVYVGDLVSVHANAMRWWYFFLFLCTYWLTLVLPDLHFVCGRSE